MGPSAAARPTVAPRQVRSDDGEPPEGRALGVDPLGEEAVLARFYRPELPSRSEAPASELERGGALPSRSGRRTRAKEKPTHYRLVCISLYNEDIARLEELVAELRRRGHSRANKSQLIRAALEQVDLDRVSKGRY
jgi:hypothetical protein